MHEPVITRDGLKRLSEELEQLMTVGRREIAERLRQATTREANQAENGDYFDAREDQALLEQRIALLEEQLRSAQIVEPEPGNGHIDIGERVRLRDLESGERLEFELVGPFESDLSAGRISVSSPLGAAILGCRRGEIAEVEAPRGRLRYKILAIETSSTRAA